MCFTKYRWNICYVCASFFHCVIIWWVWCCFYNWNCLFNVCTVKSLSLYLCNYLCNTKIRCLEASKPIIYHTDTASLPHKYATQLQNKLDVKNTKHVIYIIAVPLRTNVYLMYQLHKYNKMMTNPLHIPHNYSSF